MKLIRFISLLSLDLRLGNIFSAQTYTANPTSKRQFRYKTDTKIVETLCADLTYFLLAT